MKKQIVDICNKLYQKEFLAGCDGNVSFKDKNNIIHITPSGIPKDALKTSQICSIDLEGAFVEGNASSEKWMHLAIYQNQPKARAVVHAHPPYSIALSLARPEWKELPLSLPEIVIALGKVPFVKYVQPGTKEMGVSLIPYLNDSKSFILSHHGAVTWGESLEEAYRVMEWLEHSCRIIYLAESLGGASLLPEKELEKLFSLKNK